MGRICNLLSKDLYCDEWQGDALDVVDQLQGQEAVFPKCPSDIIVVLINSRDALYSVWKFDPYVRLQISSQANEKLIERLSE